MKQINPYNPLDLETLGQSLIREMERGTAEPLGSIGPYSPRGVPGICSRSGSLPSGGGS